MRTLNPACFPKIKHTVPLKRHRVFDRQMCDSRWWYSPQSKRRQTCQEVRGGTRDRKGSTAGCPALCKCLVTSIRREDYPAANTLSCTVHCRAHTHGYTCSCRSRLFLRTRCRNPAYNSSDSFGPDNWQDIRCLRFDSGPRPGICC